MNKYHFYTTGNKVIAVSTYAGRTVRGIAKCSDKDEFNLEKGKQLAAARCGLKIAEKRLKRADGKLIEAKEDEEKAKKYTKDMYSYYVRSAYELEDAENYLNSIFEGM